MSQSWKQISFWQMPWCEWTLANWYSKWGKGRNKGLGTVWLCVCSVKTWKPPRSNGGYFGSRMTVRFYLCVWWGVGYVCSMCMRIHMGVLMCVNVTTYMPQHVWRPEDILRCFETRCLVHWCIYRLADPLFNYIFQIVCFMWCDINFTSVAGQKQKQKIH